MHAGDAVATVSADTSMQELVVTSTRKKLGAVLVTEGKRLLGIVTDGDLRRALAHQEKFFAFKASDVMTASPITVRDDALAQQALELMENRSSQISVLPVVDSSGEWTGMIRLHDIVRSF